MFNMIKEILWNDITLFQSLPLWAVIVLLAVWLVPIGVCVWRDQKSLISRWGESRNTIHTFFWLALMLVFPCLGSVVYLLGSLLPSLIWQHRGGRGQFPLSFRLRKWQLLAVLGSVMIPELLLLAFSTAAGTGLLTQYDWTFEVSFLCTVAVIFSDWLLTVHFCAVYLRTSPQDHEPMAAGEVLGVPRFRTAETAIGARHLLRQEAKRMRRMANAVFAQHTYDAELPGKRIQVMTENGEEFCRVVGTKQDWMGERPDFMEMQYIGRGITRCRICTWEERFGKLRCTESILYRAVPSMGGWLRRTLILLTLQVALGSAAAAQLHMTTWTLLSKWI